MRLKSATQNRRNSRNVDDALTIAKRFVGEPTNIRDLELAILRHMEHHIKKSDLRWIDQNNRLRAALSGLVDHYVEMVNSGDCGFWDPETDDEIIAARAALSATP